MLQRFVNLFHKLFRGICSLW